MALNQRELIARRDAGFLKLRRITIGVGMAAAGGVLLLAAVAGITIPGRAPSAGSSQDGTQQTAQNAPAGQDGSGFVLSGGGGQSFQQPAQQPAFGGFGGGGFSSGSS